MGLWFAIFISVTCIVTLTKYVLGHNKSSLKDFLVYSVGTSLVLGVIFATFGSLGIYLFN